MIPDSWQVPQLQLKLQYPQSPSEPFAALHSTVPWAHMGSSHMEKLAPSAQTISQQLSRELLLLEGVCKQGLWRGVTVMHCRQRNGLGWLFLLFMIFYASMRNSHEQSEAETCSCVSQLAPLRDMHFIYLVPMGVHKIGPRSCCVYTLLS